MNNNFKWLVMLLSLLFLMGCTQQEPTTPLADTSMIEGYASLEEGENSLGVVKVMTWNVYVGTNVDYVLDAEDFYDLTQRVKVAYDTFQLTNFPERAQAIARQIKKYRPDLIGLQEVSLVQHFDVDGQTLLEECNFLQILLDAIAAQGMRYRLADSVQNIDIIMPRLISFTPPANFVLDYIRLLDADVILVNRDVQFSNTIKGEYLAKLPVPSPTGDDIIIPRGYVSVEARVRNKSYRFINTHLEAFTEQVRYPQAQELAAIFSSDSIPNILVGDMNTGDPTPPTPYNDATYQFLTGIEGGFVDSWVYNQFGNQGNGYTSPFSAALRDPYPDLYQRIDLILVKNCGDCTVRHPIGPVWAEVIGDELKDRTISRLWPSDHAGVVAQLHLRKDVAIACGEMVQE
jgi:endonuclease/exonuclease/phosphatase family metal-dependent hydrolase